MNYELPEEASREVRPDIRHKTLQRKASRRWATFLSPAAAVLVLGCSSLQIDELMLWHAEAVEW